jgi:hypothetical protein
MRFEAIKTPNGVSLVFSGDGVVKSTSISDGEVKKKTVVEGIALLADKLIDMIYKQPPYYEIDDEDDADLSLYEEEVVVEGYSPREYLENIGVV